MPRRSTAPSHKGSDAAARASFICLTAFAIVFVLYTGNYLPETVATHFGTDGKASGWMTRSGYLIFILSFMLGMSSFVSLVVGMLPRKFPQWTNVPNRKYWFSPERRDESLSFLSAHGKRLGCLILMMMLGMHYSVLVANQLRPAMLPTSIFSSVIMGFALALIWWIVRLYRRFGKTSQ